MLIQVAVTVGKKVSMEVSKNVWRTVHYELTGNTGAENIADVEKLKAEMEAVIDKWLAVHTGKLTRNAAEPDRVPLSEVPRIDIAQLNELPWLGKGKVDARKGGWGWIYSDIKERIERHEEKDRYIVGELGRAIRMGNGKVVIGDMEYKYGKNTEFFNRYPIKRESARR